MMFRKKANGTRSEGNAAVDPQVAVVARGMEVRGSVQRGDEKSPFVLHVSGTIEGDVQAQEVVIDADGCVAGTITAEQAVIRGKFDGTVIATRVVIEDGATVTGKVEYNFIRIHNADVTADLQKREGRRVIPQGQQAQGTAETTPQEEATEMTPYNMHKSPTKPESKAA